MRNVIVYNRMKRILCIYNQHDYKSIYRYSKMEQILSTIATLNMLYRSETASISPSRVQRFVYNWSVSCVWVCTITSSSYIGNHLKEDFNRSQTQ